MSKYRFIAAVIVSAVRGAAPHQTVSTDERSYSSTNWALAKNTTIGGTTSKLRICWYYMGVINIFFPRKHFTFCCDIFFIFHCHTAWILRPKRNFNHALIIGFSMLHVNTFSILVKLFFLIPIMLFAISYHHHALEINLYL